MKKRNQTEKYETVARRSELKCKKVKLVFGFGGINYVLVAKQKTKADCGVGLIDDDAC
jgi:hypothetical protein